MKKYTTPALEFLLLSAQDVLMASDENVTAKDYIDNENLVIGDIETV